jgi:peptidoglycan biosynthesis protein MviN/MurJ (putative lipid II flippase)
MAEDMKPDGRGRHHGMRASLIGTILGNAPGFLLPFLVTWRIGAGELTDAFFFALGIGLFGSSVCVIVVEANSLPILQKVVGQPSVFRARIGALKKQAIRGVVVMYLPVAAVGAALIWLGDWSSDTKSAATAVVLIMGMTVCVIAANSVSAAALYSEKKFFAPTATEACRTVAPLFALPFISADAWSIVALAVLTLAGEVARTVVLRRRLPARSSSQSDVEEPHERLWSTARAHAMAVVVANMSPVIDRTVAIALATGAVTLIELGEKVVYVPMILLMYTVILVGGTRWAAMTEPVERFADYSHSLRSVAWLAVVAAVALTAATLGGSALVTVHIGTLSQQTVVLTLVTLYWGIPAAASAAATSRFLTATQQTKWFPALAGAMFAMNCALDVIGAVTLGIVGVAASTTVTRWVSAGMYHEVCRRVTRPSSIEPTFSSRAAL